MKLLKYSVFIFFICLVYTSLQAQEQKQTQSINEGSISDQFEFVIKKSTNWSDEKGQAYEVVKLNLMFDLRAHTLDSLNAIQANLDNTKNIVSAQQKEINTLKSNLANIQDTLASTNKEKDSMVLLGTQLSKSNYSFLMWSIIVALLAFLLIFIYKFKNSNIVTKDTKSALADLENEFNEYRGIALKREQEVRRLLQDEINKHSG